MLGMEELSGRESDASALWQKLKSLREEVAHARAALLSKMHMDTFYEVNTGDSNILAMYVEEALREVPRFNGRNMTVFFRACKRAVDLVPNTLRRDMLRFLKMKLDDRTYALIGNAEFESLDDFISRIRGIFAPLETLNYLRGKLDALSKQAREPMLEYIERTLQLRDAIVDRKRHDLVRRLTEREIARVNEEVVEGFRDGLPPYLRKLVRDNSDPNMVFVDAIAAEKHWERDLRKHESSDRGSYGCRGDYMFCEQRSGIDSKNRHEDVEPNKWYVTIRHNEYKARVEASNEPEAHEDSETFAKRVSNADVNEARSTAKESESETLSQDGLTKVSSKLNSLKVPEPRLMRARKNGNRSDGKNKSFGNKGKTGAQGESRALRQGRTSEGVADAVSSGVREITPCNIEDVVASGVSEGTPGNVKFLSRRKVVGKQYGSKKMHDANVAATSTRVVLGVADVTRFAETKNVDTLNADEKNHSAIKEIADLCSSHLYKRKFAAVNEANTQVSEFVGDGRTDDFKNNISVGRMTKTIAKEHRDGDGRERPKCAGTRSHFLLELSGDSRLLEARGV